MATDQIQRVQNLRAQLEQRRTTLARAQAAHDQATQQLTAIFTEHGVTSVDELRAKAIEAGQAAEELLAAAERAVSQ